MGRVFAFEGENNVTLEWMPLDVRRKLDLAGVRLSLAAWQALKTEQRALLVSTEIASAADVAVYRELAIELGKKAVGKVENLVPVTFDTRPWTTDIARDEVLRRAAACGLPFDPSRWNGLDDGARYALFRLADPSKPEDKLRAALTELGLV